MIRILLVFNFLLLCLVSCNKAEDRSCFKSAGEESELTISLEPFDQLYLKEHLEYVLIQDSIEKIVIKGGKNLLNFVDATVTDKLLEISNGNKCNFLRSYKKKVKVEIHFKTLSNIHFEGTEPLTNIGTLQFQWVTMLVRDGAGSVKLNFNAEALVAVISHGWGDFTFTGEVNNANLTVRSNGFCDVYGLKVQDTLIAISKTQGTMKVNADNCIFKAQIDAGGDILYKGIPSFKSLNQYGTGELIDAN
jgi:hypothetical protein